MKLSSIITKILVSCILFFSSINPVSAQKIGLQLYSLRNQFKTDVPGTLAKIKDWNISEIEGGGTYGLTMAEYKELLAKNGLQMVSVSVDFKQLTDNLQAAIDEAKAFGAQYVTCFWIPHTENNFAFNDIKNACEVFNKAGKQFAEAGLKFCYHPHGYEFKPYENGTMFDYMVKNTDSKYVNFEMDVFWVKQPGQDPVALLRKYPARFPMLHLKDRQPGTEGNQNGRAPDESNVVLGQGDVGIADIMKEAKKIGVKHYFTEDESPKSVEQMPQSLQFLQSLNKK